MFKYILFAVTFFLLVCCSDNSTDNPVQQKIKISAILDLSGHYSQFGIESKQAMELMQVANKNLEIAFYDSKGLSTVADSLLNHIISKGEKTPVVTLASWISNDLAAKFAQNNMLQIPIGSAAFSNSNLLSSIKMTEGVDDESTLLINKLNEYNRIAVMYFNNDYGVTWNATLSGSLGAKIVQTEPYSDIQVDFTAELNRIKEKNPEVVVLISTKEAATIVNQANSLGITAQFFGTRPILTNYLLDEPSAEGLIFTYPKIDYTNKYIKDFQTKYGYKPGSFTAESIDLCLLLQKAASNKKFSRDEIFQFVKNSNLYDCAFKSINFNENCEANYEFTLMKVKNGSFDEIK